MVAGRPVRSFWQKTARFLCRLARYRLALRNYHMPRVSRSRKFSHGSCILRLMGRTGGLNWIIWNLQHSRRSARVRIASPDFEYLTTLVYTEYRNITSLFVQWRQWCVVVLCVLLSCFVPGLLGSGLHPALVVLLCSVVCQSTPLTGELNSNTSQSVVARWKSTFMTIPVLQ